MRPLAIIRRLIRRLLAVVRPRRGGTIPSYKGDPGSVPVLIAPGRVSPELERYLTPELRERLAGRKL